MKIFSLSISIISIFFLTACASSIKVENNEVGNSVELTEKEFRIAFVSERDGQSDIYSMKSDGSGVVRLTNDAAIDSSPVWSPDRTQLAYFSYVEDVNGIERSKIIIINADGTGRRQLFDRPLGELSPAWSPDGKQILYTGRLIYLASVDGRSDEILFTDPNFDILQVPTWSPDGQQIAFVALAASGDEIRIMAKDGSGVRTLTNGYFPAWSPDGQKIAFQLFKDEQYDIFVINVDGSDLQQLTNEPGNDVCPDWSPDGDHIVFASNRDKNAEIYIMNADGSNQIRLTNSPQEDSFPAWWK